MSFDQLDLNLLKVFDAIFQTHSVTEAGSSLLLAQSSVSKQLNRLREALGDPLFVRTRDGMSPTPRAEALSGPIREALSGVRSAIERQMGFDPRTSDRTYRIFMSDLGQMIFLPKLLELVSHEAPSVNVHTVQVPTASFRNAALESGAVDLAIGDLGPTEGSLHNQKLFEDHYVGVVRANHPIIRDSLSFQQFLTTPQIMYQPPGGGHVSQESVVDNAFWAAGVERRVAVRVAHTIGITSLVSITDVLLVVPYRMAMAFRSEHRDVTVLELPIEIPKFEIGQYWHERFDTDPANAWLRDSIARLFAGSQAHTDNRPQLGSDRLDS
jgi:DNA-binding transcriptional LysR family regulator